jgi:MoxR-like ATPase
MNDTTHEDAASSIEGDVTLVGRGEALPKIAVDVTVLPETQFENAQIAGKVGGIASIGEVIVTVFKEEGYSQVAAFDQTAHRLNLPLDPTINDLVTGTVDSYIGTDKASPYHYPHAENILANIGYPSAIAKRGGQAFDTWAKKNSKLSSSPEYCVYRGTLDTFKNIALPTEANWDIGIGQVGASGQPSFVFTTGESQFVLDPEKIRKNIVEDNVKQIYGHPKSAEKVSIPSLTFSENIEVHVAGNVIEVRKDGNTVGSFSGNSVVRDPSTPDTVYFINTDHVYSMDVSKAARKQAVPIQEAQIDVKNLQELAIDPHGNFLVIRSGNTVTIVDKLSGEVMNHVSEVKGPIHIDDQGDILFIDTQNKLREAQTNFKAIPPGGTHAASGVRETRLKEMESRFSNLRLDDPNALSTQAPTSETKVEKTLRETVKREVEAKLGETPTEDTLEGVLDRLTQFREDPQNRGFEHVFDEFSGVLQSKLTGMRVDRLKQGMETFGKQLGQVSSVGDSVSVEDGYLELVALRQKIDITDIKIRHEIEAQLKTIEAKKNEIVTKYQGELVSAIRSQLPNVKALIDEAGSVEELSAFDATSEARRIDLMIANVKDPNDRRTLREEYRAMKTERRTAVESSQRQADLEKNIRYAETLDDVHAELEALGTEVARLNDPKEIDRFRRSAAVTTLKGRLLMLPPELRTAEEKKLDILFSTRRLDIKHITDLGVKVTSDTVKLGTVEFPRFREQRFVFSPKLEPVSGNTHVAKLKFMDQNGRIYKLEGVDITVRNDLSDPNTASTVERYRTVADEFFRGIKRRVPEFSQFWRITPSLEDKFGEIAETLKMQLDHHQGVLILQGEAGTGKNVIADIFGNLTNREICTIACNENTTKEDMQFEFQYDPGRGTYKLPSKLVEALQTPGSVIVFDEINALKPGIAKLLNSLFDYRRRIYLSEGGKTHEIMVDPSVILLGTMNPQNYAGVNRLSPEVKSRARIIDIPYPPFEERRSGAGVYYRPDEAYMLASYVDGLADLNRQEFTEVWDAVINKSHGAATGIAKALLSATPDFETRVRNLYDVVRVENKLRTMYEAYQVGESTEPMDFPTSLREGSDIVMELNYRKDVLDSVMRVIPPKIDDRRQRKLVEESIKAELVKP